MTSQTDALNQTTLYDYDELGRKLVETNALNQEIRFTYNPAGDLLTLTDGKAQTTTWQYDVYGRVTEKRDANNTVLFTYGYDANGRLTNRWSAGQGGGGISTKYAYDAVGNLTVVDYPTSPDLTLTYDPNNRLTNLVDGVGTTRFTYSAFGALLSEDGPWADDTVSYSYNDRRVRSQLNLAQPGVAAWTQTYGYDAAGRLTNVVSPAGAFGYRYRVGQVPVFDLEGAYEFFDLPTAGAVVEEVVLPNGAAITNEYDAVVRLLSTTLRNTQDAVLNRHAYDYNWGHQRTRQTRTGGDYVDYGYDALGQLTSAAGQQTNATVRLQEQFGYAYDAAQNLNWRTNDALVQAFNVNALNQLTNVTRSGALTVAGFTTAAATNVTVNGGEATRYADYTFARTNVSLADGTNTFTAIAKASSGWNATNVVTAYLPATNTYSYDLNGNLLSDGLRAFDYDDENQLIQVTVTNAWKSEFYYDGKMRRRIRREFTWLSSISNWQLTNEVHYVYDGNLVVQERDGNNNPVVTYTRGLDLSGTFEGAGGIGGLLAISRPMPGLPPHYYYHADGNGNITMLVNTQQLIVAKYLYEPFGNLIAMNGPMADVNLYRFSSKEAHPNSGLIYYGYRFYEPTLQRWINRDPLEEQGGLNLLSFARNDPVDLLDPSGEQPSGGGAPGPSPPIIQPQGTIFPQHHASLDKDSCQVSSTSGNAPPANTPSSCGYESCKVKGAKRYISDPYKQTLECPCTGTLEQTCIKYQECSESNNAVLSGTKPVLQWMPKTLCSPRGCPEYDSGKK